MVKKTLYDVIAEDEAIQEYKTIIRNAGEIPPPFSMFTENLTSYREDLKKKADSIKNKK